MKVPSDIVANIVSNIAGSRLADGTSFSVIPSYGEVEELLKMLVSVLESRGKVVDRKLLDVSDWKI